MKTNAQYVRASEARSIKAGAVRIPGGLLPREAAEALKRLTDSGYAPSKTGCIVRAIMEADAGMKAHEW